MKPETKNKHHSNYPTKKGKKGKAVAKSNRASTTAASESTAVSVWDPSENRPAGLPSPQALSQQGLSHLTPQNLERLRVLADRFGAVANDVATGRATAGAAPQFTAEIAAGLYSGDSNWRHLYYSVLLVHPDPLARLALACTGPLGILRALVYDPDPTVRYGLLENPLVVDADIQAALAADPEEAIVVGLLETVSPSRRTSAAIIAGPHTKAKQLLASFRVSSNTLESLAQSSDRLTRITAKKQLAGRRQLTQGGK
jgi:hypothetical protein